MNIKELREGIAERIFSFHKEYGNVTPWYKSCASEILALIPKPTVKVKCGKCTDGQVTWEAGGKQITEPCTCKDGMVEREVVWDMSLAEVKSRINVGGHCHEHVWLKGEKHEFTLSYFDLGDPDVARAFANLVKWDYKLRQKYGSFPIPNNKGTLRLEVIDGEYTRNVARNRKRLQYTQIA